MISRLHITVFDAGFRISFCHMQSVVTFRRQGARPPIVDISIGDRSSRQGRVTYAFCRRTAPVKLMLSFWKTDRPMHRKEVTFEDYTWPNCML